MLVFRSHFKHYSATRWNDENGATLVEAVIVIPIVLLVVFVIIDFTFISARQYLFHDAVRSTARALQSQFDSCEEFIREELGSQLDDYRITDLHVTHQGANDTVTFLNGVTPFVLTVEGQFACLFCRFVPANSRLINFTSSALVIFEPGATCTPWGPSALLCPAGTSNPGC